jgi:ankyrin repeat protein
LHVAANADRKEVAELLIAAGAGVNTKTDDGWTPLQFAAKSGHKEVAELLIAEGADVNAKIRGGWTVLDEVTHPDNPNKNKAQIADLLRKHGGKKGEK